MIRYRSRLLSAVAAQPAQADAAAAARVMALSLGLVAIIAALDHFTGYDVRLSILYLVPIALATWNVGGKAGVLVAIVATTAWLITFESAHPYGNPLYFYWEGAITGFSFLVITVLLARLRTSLARELLERHREEAHRTARLVALGEFASALAHELNQPLAAIAAYNDTALRLLDDPGTHAAELREAVEKCRDQAKRAAAIIQRLREVLRQPQQARAEQDLNEVARAALELAQPEAKRAGVALAFNGAPGARVRGDRLLIEQVALNLLRNAIESVRPLPAERRQVTVETAMDAEGHAMLAVSDLGEGVPAQVREHLFDAFVTTKADGLGLGLAICRSVVEAHGGSIHHQANGARGARFAVVLPGPAT